MRVITKWGSPGFTATAEEHFLLFFKQYFYASERSSYYFFMVAITERVIFRKSATAPGIDLARFHPNVDRLAGCGPG